MIASWQESDDKLRQCVEKQSHYSANKGPYNQGCGLPSGHVWLWELDGKEGRMSKYWCLLLWCSRRLLRVPWIASRLNQSILREIKADSSLKGLLLMLKLQYFGHLVWTEDSWEKSLMLVKIKAWRRRGHQRMRWLDSITNTMNMNNLVQTPGDGEGQGGLACCSPWGWEKSGMTG